MNKTILLTGGAGVVGRALLEKLTSGTVFCLTHRKPLSGPNIITIPGDVSQPMLGLPATYFHELAKRVDWIIHAAAITDFTRSVADLWPCNVDGVRNVLAFAEQANAPLIHVSTAFIHTRGNYPLNNYEVSKRAAEQVIAESGIPAVIVRPSIVLGDAHTGAVYKFQGMHRIQRLLIKELLPVVPGSLNALIDFVPQDSVADAILGLIQQNVVHGEYWLTAGEQALHFHEALDVLIEHASLRLGRPLARPRTMHPDAFNRLIRPVFFPAFPERLQHMFEEALDFLKYINMEEPFPSSFAWLTQALGIPPLPDARQTLQRSVAYIITQSQKQGRTGQTSGNKEKVHI